MGRVVMGLILCRRNPCDNGQRRSWPRSGARGLPIYSCAGGKCTMGDALAPTRVHVQADSLPSSSGQRRCSAANCPGADCQRARRERHQARRRGGAYPARLSAAPAHSSRASSDRATPSIPNIADELPLDLGRGRYSGPRQPTRAAGRGAALRARARPLRGARPARTAERAGETKCQQCPIPHVDQSRRELLDHAPQLGRAQGCSGWARCRACAEPLFRFPSPAGRCAGDG